MNSDNKVDLTDLTMLSLYLLGDRQFNDTQLKSADVSYDGSVDIGDLAYLKQYVCQESVILGPK